MNYPIRGLTFEECFEGGEQFIVRPFKKPDGKPAIHVEAEDGEVLDYELFTNIALPLKGKV